MSDKTLKKYNCGYCKPPHEFEQEVGTVMTGAGGKHSTVSSQVQCPQCRNFLKT